MTRLDARMQNGRPAHGSQAAERRVELTRHTSPRDFREFYWLKTELQDFCREHGISRAGGKREIADRIERFLGSGDRVARVQREQDAPRDREAARRFNTMNARQFTMKTRIPVGFRCTQQLRTFFERNVDPEFRFTVTLQNYIKAHPGILFEQLAAYWRGESRARKADEFKPEIAPQFEFNQFTRDFHADPANRGKTRRDCLDAWKRTRDARGENKYRPGNR